MSEDQNIFINRKDERKQSALAKLKLLVYGVQDAPELFIKNADNFKEEHYAYDNGNWGVDKNRLTPSEVLLPGGIVSKLHIRPDSPYRLVQDGNRLFIRDEHMFLSEFRFLERPKFWDYKTGNGNSTKNVGQMYGLNALNFNLYSGCEFHMDGKACKFCSVMSTVKRGNPVDITKDVQDIVDTCKLAVEHDDVKYILITSGSYLDRDYEFERHMQVIKSIRPILPWNGIIKGNISMMPPKDMTKLKMLHDYGVENPSFNMEVWPSTNFAKICPGKEEYVGFDHVVASLLYLQDIYGPGKVWSNFVAGLVPLEDIKKGFQFMAEHGIVPGANLYHAEVGSVIGKSLGRIDEQFVLSVFGYAVELYHKYGYKPFFNTSVLRNSLTNEIYEGLL